MPETTASAPVVKAKKPTWSQKFADKYPKADKYMMHIIMGVILFICFVGLILAIATRH